MKSIFIKLCFFCFASVCQIDGVPLNSENGDFEEQDFSNFVSHGKKIIGVGRNYRFVQKQFLPQQTQVWIFLNQKVVWFHRWKNSDLAKALQIPDKPIIFLKPSSSYITNGSKIEVNNILNSKKSDKYCKINNKHFFIQITIVTPGFGDCIQWNRARNRYRKTYEAS